MSVISYLVKNILFLGPLLAGPLIAERKDTNYNSGQYIYLIYTFVLGVFLIFSILKQVYSPGQRAVSKEQLKRIGEITISEESDIFGGGSDFYIFRGLRNFILVPGAILDFLFFPKNKFNFVISFITIFSFSVIAWIFSVRKHNTTGDTNTSLNILFSIFLGVTLLYLIYYYINSKGVIYN